MISIRKRHCKKCGTFLSRPSKCKASAFAMIAAVQTKGKANAIVFFLLSYINLLASSECWKTVQKKVDIDGNFLFNGIKFPYNGKIGGVMTQSLEKVVHILDCLSNGLNRFSDICKETGLPISTAHRLLGSMKKTGLALQDPVHRLYYLGPVILGLASNPLSAHNHLITMAQDELKFLQKMTRETTALHVLLGNYQICLDEHVSLEPIKFMIGKGKIGKVATGSSGKVLLAQLNDGELNKIREKFVWLNEQKGETNSLSVFSQIFSIREQGYAESVSVRQRGVMGISAPIYNYIFPLALSVGGPESRVAEKREVIIDLLKKSAGRLTEKLSL